MSTARLMALARGKSAVRAMSRRLGYDFVPFTDSFRDTQRRLLADTDAVLDVGANTGQYVDLVRSLGFTGHVHSFEPGSEAYAVVASRASADPQWDVHRKALGEQPGRDTLNLSENSKSSSLLGIRIEHVSAAPSSRTRAQEVVDIATLDDVLPTLSPSSDRWWLKVDVQGYELPVLRGAARSMKAVGFVQCELSLSPLYHGQSDWLEVCTVLRDHGLHLVHVESGFQDPSTGQVLQIDGLFARLGAGI